MNKRTHKRVDWEKEGCGKPPYRFRGQEDSSAGANADGLVRPPSNDGLEHWTTPGGTCAVCGAYIVVFYNFISSDGIKFHVGCECAEQANLPVEVLSQVRKAKREHNAKLRHAREAKKLVELDELLSKHTWSNYEHPYKWAREQGKTLQDYVDYMLRMSGTSGKIKMLKLLKSVVE